MNIFTDELIYQYIITGAFVFVINTFLLFSCANAMTPSVKEELYPENNTEDNNSEEDNNNLEADTEDNNNSEENADDNNNSEEDSDDNNNSDEDNNSEEQVDEDKEKINILNTSDEKDSHLYKGFNLMTKKQLIRFVGKEHTYKNKNELIIIAINKFILISIDRVDSIPVFVRNYVKNF
jgi:hypothetical protein